MLLLAICLIFALAYIMMVWFKTEAFVEYARVFGLGKWHVIENYEKMRNGGEMDFPTFLSLEYDSFFTRLISCPVCLSFWLAAVPSFLLSIAAFLFILVETAMPTLAVLASVGLFPTLTFGLAGLSLLLYLVLARLY